MQKVSKQTLLFGITEEETRIQADSKVNADRVQVRELGYSHPKLSSAACWIENCVQCFKSLCLCPHLQIISDGHISPSLHD